MRLMFAADALVRFRDGQIVIHATGASAPAFVTGQPMVVGWLCQFARPVEVDAALSALSPADRAAIAPVLDQLRRGGILVEPDAPRAAPPAAEHADALSRKHLQVLARTVYDLACDLHAFGPHAERAVASRSGIGVERRLAALLAGVDGLRAELAALRAPFVAEQARRLGLDGAARGLQLHVGCGPCLIEGFVNIDVHPAPLSLNVNWGLPFDDGSVQRVFVSHLLEHLFHPRDVAPFLAELRRVLAPGGTVRVVVPDVAQCIEAYVKRDATFFASRRETWSWWPDDATPLEDFLAYAGAGPEPAWLFESHKYGYDFETLAKRLAEAGFVDIERSAFMASRDPGLRVDAHSVVAAATYGDRHYALFVDASAPGAAA